jgi:hypothetical protein
MVAACTCVTVGLRALPAACRAKPFSLQCRHGRRLRVSPAVPADSIRVLYFVPFNTSQRGDEEDACELYDYYDCATPPGAGGPFAHLATWSSATGRQKPTCTTSIGGNMVQPAMMDIHLSTTFRLQASFSSLLQPALIPIRRFHRRLSRFVNPAVVGWHAWNSQAAPGTTSAC